MRLFVTVSPPEEVLALVEALPRPNLATLRWTTPDQWHVTLRFLGEVERWEPVAKALRQVPATLREAGVGELEAVLGPAVAWFSGRRVLQVPVAGIELLAAHVWSASAKWGASLEPGPYTGHLTLARVRGQDRGPASLSGTPIRAAWRVEKVELMCSTLGSGVAHYDVLEAVPLS